MKLIMEQWRRFLREGAFSNLRAYHGSPNAVFPEFELRPSDDRTTDYGWFGDGLYFDTSIRHAIDYAGGAGYDVIDQNVDRVEKALQGDKSNIISSSGAIRMITKDEDPNAGVYALNLNLTNSYEWKGPGLPSIIDNPHLHKMPSDIADGVAKKMNYPSWEELVSAMESPQSADKEQWEKWLADSATRALKDLGYDSVKMTRSNGNAEIVVFDTSKIERALK